DGSAILWSARTGKPVGVLQRKRPPVYEAAFARDGKLLFTSQGNTVIGWRLPPGGGAVPKLSEAGRKDVDEWHKKFGLLHDGVPAHPGGKGAGSEAGPGRKAEPNKDRKGPK